MIGGMPPLVHYIQETSEERVARLKSEREKEGALVAIHHDIAELLEAVKEIRDLLKNQIDTGNL